MASVHHIDDETPVATAVTTSTSSSSSSVSLSPEVSLAHHDSAPTITDDSAATVPQHHRHHHHHHHHHNHHHHPHQQDEHVSGFRFIITQQLLSRNRREVLAFEPLVLKNILHPCRVARSPSLVCVTLLESILSILLDFDL